MRGPGCGMADCIDFFARTVVDFENRSHVVVPEKSVAKDETKKQKKDTVQWFLELDPIIWQFFRLLVWPSLLFVGVRWKEGIMAFVKLQEVWPL